MYAIEARGLTKKFGEFTALDNLSLSIEKGQSCAVLGPNGAGKTTLIRILSTVMKPTSGKVLLNGHDAVNEGDEARKSIGLVSHNPLLYEELTVRENLEFYAGLFEVETGLEEIISDLGLAAVESRLVGELSRGMKQRAAIARALLHSPQILLLDEPTTGLDIKSRELFRSLIQEFKSKGATVVMSTHLLEEAAKLCRRGVVLNRGRIVREVDLHRGVGEAAETLRGLK